MELKTYKTNSGNTYTVIEFDEERGRVRAEDESGIVHWFSKDDCASWQPVTESGDSGSEEIADQTTSGIDHCPITEEPKPKRKTTKKK